MSRNIILPPFDALMSKEPKELVQILLDCQIKLPEDDYNTKSIIKQAYGKNGKDDPKNVDLIYIIGKKYILQITSSLVFNVFSIETEEDAADLNEIKNGKYKRLKNSNPVGPAMIMIALGVGILIDLEFYYIKGKYMTEKKFVNHIRIKQRTKAIK